MNKIAFDMSNIFETRLDAIGSYNTMKKDDFWGKPRLSSVKMGIVVRMGLAIFLTYELHSSGLDIVASIYIIHMQVSILPWPHLQIHRRQFLQIPAYQAQLRQAQVFPRRHLRLRQGLGQPACSGTSPKAKWARALPSS